MAAVRVASVHSAGVLYTSLQKGLIDPLLTEGDGCFAQN
jgi:hypothetical protein